METKRKVTLTLVRQDCDFEDATIHLYITTGLFEDFEGLGRHLAAELHRLDRLVEDVFHVA